MVLAKFLRVLMIAFMLSPVLPATAKDVTLQVVATSYNQSLVSWLSGSARNQRVLEFGPKIFDGVAKGRYSLPSRNMSVKVFFWMKPGFESSASVKRGVANMKTEVVSSYGYSGGRLSFSSQTYRSNFQRNFESLPFAMSGVNSTPDFAVTASFRSAVGIHIDDDFLREVDFIMICPDQDTVWPRRTGGYREGLIITNEEVARWLRQGFQKPTAGIMDSR